MLRDPVLLGLGLAWAVLFGLGALAQGDQFLGVHLDQRLALGDHGALGSQHFPGPARRLGGNLDLFRFDPAIAYQYIRTRAHLADLKVYQADVAQQQGSFRPRGLGAIQGP